MFGGFELMTLHPTKSIKIKRSHILIYDTLFGVFKTDKEYFTLYLMRKCKINKADFERYETINDFFLYLLENLQKELKIIPFDDIHLANMKKGRTMELNLYVSSIYDEASKRKNGNFRVSTEAMNTVRQIKEQYKIFPLGVVVEVMIDLFISQLSEEEYFLVKESLKGLSD